MPSTTTACGTDMQIELYTREQCEFCELAKSLLTFHHIQYTLYVIGKDIDRQAVLDKFPGIESVRLPIVVVDGTNIGSTEQLIELIKDKQ